MKKFLIGIFILFIAVSCTQNKTKTDDNSSASAEGDSLPPQRITLNGIPFDEADKMVKAFQSDQTSSDSKTNVWFGKNYLSQICTLLTAEKADGIRIYFARRADGKNTVVIVSTKANGTSTSTSKKRHKDYFEHSSPFLSTAEARSKDDHGNDAGAILYKPQSCPGETCRDGLHRIKCVDAYKWVGDFGSSTAKIQTKAVWFGIDLLYDLRDELNAAPRGDGIRMYFALKPSPEKHNLVIVTTEDGRQDYLKCYNTNFRSVSDNGEECPHLCEPGDATWN